MIYSQFGPICYIIMVRSRHMFDVLSETLRNKHYSNTIIRLTFPELGVQMCLHQGSYIFGTSACTSYLLLDRALIYLSIKNQCKTMNRRNDVSYRCLLACCIFYSKSLIIQFCRFVRRFTYLYDGKHFTEAESVSACAMEMHMENNGK